MLLFLLSAFVYILFLPSNSSLQVDKSTLNDSTVWSCKDAENRSCNVGNCSGMQRCTNGTWGNCLVNTICTPGSTDSCIKNGCACGVKVCNECGDSYGPCINRTDNNSCIR